MPDPVAVVTGAAANIGAAISTALRAAGWRVVGVDVTPWTPATGESAVIGDVTEPRTLAAAVDAARTAGRLQGWVNNAAVVQLRPFEEADDDHVRTMLDVDLRGYLLGARAAVREFLAGGGGGAIVNVSSVHARMGFAQHALYDTCKAGVEGLTRSLAAEFGPRGIRSNAVAPGAVLTDREVAARAAGPLAEEPIPLRLFSTPAEIAAVVTFLLDPVSAAVNGATIAADKGLSSTFLGGQPG